MIRPSRLRLTFPIRISDPLFDEEDAREKYINTKEIIVPETVKAMVSVDIEDILFWRDDFPNHRKIADVREKGFSSTLVIMKDSLADDFQDTGFLCAWKKSKFEEEYDKVVEAIKEYNQQNK